MTGAPASVLFRLAEALEALETAADTLDTDEGMDVSPEAYTALDEVIGYLYVTMALIEPDLDRLAQAAAGILEDG